MRKRLRLPKIHKKGKWYYFRITDSFGGRKPRRFITKEQAQTSLTEMLNQVMSSLSDTPTYKTGIEQGIDFWLRQKDGHIDETSFLRYRIYTNNFKAFLRNKHPELQFFDAIKPEHIKEFMDYRTKEKGKAPKTVNSERQALFNLFTILIEHNKIPDFNPVTKIKALKKQSVQKRRCLTDNELCLFFDGARAETKEINWFGIYFSLYITGMRRDEVRKLNKSAISDDTITILDTKTDKPKIIPIHPQLKPVLEGAIKQSKSNLAFPNSDGKMLHKNALRDKMIQICQKVGIPKATVHDLRHTFASRRGLSDRAKQAIGGWSSREVMEKTYMHTPEDAIREEYFKVDYIPKPKNNCHTNGTNET